MMFVQSLTLLFLVLVSLDRFEAAPYQKFGKPGKFKGPHAMSQSYPSPTKLNDKEEGGDDDDELKPLYPYGEDMPSIMAELHSGKKDFESFGQDQMSKMMGQYPHFKDMLHGSGKDSKSSMMGGDHSEKKDAESLGQDQISKMMGQYPYLKDMLFGSEKESMPSMMGGDHSGMKGPEKVPSLMGGITLDKLLSMVGGDESSEDYRKGRVPPIVDGPLGKGFLLGFGPHSSFPMAGKEGHGKDQMPPMMGGKPFGKGIFSGLEMLPLVPKAGKDCAQKSAHISVHIENAVFIGGIANTTVTGPNIHGPIGPGYPTGSSSKSDKMMTMGPGHASTDHLSSKSDGMMTIGSGYVSTDHVKQTASEMMTEEVKTDIPRRGGVYSGWEGPPPS